MILAESEHYIVSSEYEAVILTLKSSQKAICIGDFYGDPKAAVISEDEKFCAMCGCGVIVYFLREPFEEYKYDTKTAQWKDWGRSSPDDTVWVENVKCSDNQHILIEPEKGNAIKLNIYRDL